jgi:hypothetical protein
MPRTRKIFILAAMLTALLRYDGVIFSLARFTCCEHFAILLSVVVRASYSILRGLLRAHRARICPCKKGELRVTSENMMFPNQDLTCENADFVTF